MNKQKGHRNATKKPQSNNLLDYYILFKCVNMYVKVTCGITEV